MMPSRGIELIERGSVHGARSAVHAGDRTLINVVTCALWAGARVTIMPRFDVTATWAAIAEDDLTLFMAVPTIYARLIEALEGYDAAHRARCSAACRRMRLMVSGSAALPVQVLEKWRAITGHVLLERYGMTEIGMALSNPLHGERRAGFVGSPLPGVEIRLVDEDGLAVPDGKPGEIEVRGAAVFREYWRRSAETQAAFRDGWFRTGDVAVVEGGAYRILGRNSVDIIKTAGYKVSALEIEEVLRTHSAVQECAVVGVQDADRGERVCAAVVPGTSAQLDVLELREWAKQRLAPYKVPGLVLLVEDLPRNAMGKVLKPEVARLLTMRTYPLRLRGNEMAQLITFQGRAPRVHPSAFLAPTAVLIGDVEVGAEASIWFGAVLRADHPHHGIRVGERTSIQDNCVLHVSERGPTIVEQDVTVGHGAAFESCTIRRGALIGMNAVLLHECEIGEDALVAALSVVPTGMHVPARTLVAGAPARIRKQLDEQAVIVQRSNAEHYVELARDYNRHGLTVLVATAQITESEL